MIVVLGKNGLLGQAFTNRLGDESVGLSRSEVDFTNFQELGKLLDDINPSVIINCAAKVSLSEVEENQAETFKVNTMLPFFLANYCPQSSGAKKLVHISTDHLFCDDMLAHDEAVPVTILNEYASQKYIAERLVLHQNPAALIVRTSILGTRNLDGSTLIEWILKTVKNNGEISGFVNVNTSSIPADSLVQLVKLAVDRDLSGVYNIGSESPYSKYELVAAIVDYLNLSGVKVGKAHQENATVTRATNCGLDCSAFVAATGAELPRFPGFLEEMDLRGIYDTI